MKKLTLVIDERELSIIRAALHLLQEQVDALKEDLAEMIAEHGKPMTEAEIERLCVQFNEPRNMTRNSADQEFPQARMAVEVDRYPAAATIQRPA